jgi:hypothetical protein
MLTLAISSTQVKPDFSGKWILNPAASESLPGSAERVHKMTTAEVILSRVHPEGFRSCNLSKRVSEQMFEPRSLRTP